VKSQVVKLLIGFAVLMGCMAPISGAQQPSAVVPTLVNLTGTLADANGKPLSGTLGVVFYLYRDQEGGAPLWTEIQNVRPDKSGRYTVMLGSTQSQGLPTSLFISGEARWLGVQAQGQAEQPRILLLSVPYALKAGDAQTVGGLPPSAFVLAVPGAEPNGPATSNSTSAGTSASPAPAANVTGSGTVNFLPIWTGTSTIGNSALFQTGTGKTARLGINTTAPASALDVKGGGTIRGLLSLPATGTATTSKGFNSQPEDLVASAFNSGNNAAVAQTFQWRAEPVGNNTGSAAGSLNLLFGQGSGKPTETGLHIASSGQIAFAPGQTFLGVVNSVTAGTALTNTGTSGDPILNVDTTKIPQLNANNSFTGNETVSGSITATSFSGNGAAVINVNAAQLGGLASSAFAQLAANNTFTALQTINSQVLITATSGGFALNAAGKGGPGGIQGGSNAVGGAGVAGVEIATTGSGIGVVGASNGPTGQGGLFQGGTGVLGESTICCAGVGGELVGANAPSGSGLNGTVGVLGLGGSGDLATNSAGSGGLFQGSSKGINGDGIDSVAGSGYAGNFAGDLNVSGTIFAGTKDFKIDHPLDPANKYLVHASVESSEMMNIYAGNITTDAQGEATVQLPDWFEVLNTDFRYQLTVIGQFAQAIVAREIQDHQFQIRTNAPNVKVSWQITGVRQDAFARAHPLVVEEEKGERLRGFYIHPELYGAPGAKQIEWARHPQMMKQLEEQRVKAQSAISTAARP
jgi:hypothetical protein